MRALSNADFLSLWEQGHRLHSLDRGVLAVRALLPEASEESVADWTLGRRNEALAELHEGYFGPAIEGWTECERCGEKLEFTVDCRRLVERQGGKGAERVEVSGRRFRLPTSRDLARVAGESSADEAAVRLATMCCVSESSDCAEWSREELEELGEKMSKADPLAEILLSFECPVCGATRQQVLDLPAFLWAEFESFAKRMLEEIHILAHAYGWRESEILALSDKRRAAYVQMVRG